MDLSSPNSQIYPFGLDRDKLVIALRALADKFEDETLLPQTATTITTVKQDDYTIQRVILTFVEKKA